MNTECPKCVRFSFLNDDEDFTFIEVRRILELATIRSGFIVLDLPIEVPDQDQFRLGLEQDTTILPVVVKYGRNKTPEGEALWSICFTFGHIEGEEVLPLLNSLIREMIDSLEFLDQDQVSAGVLWDKPKRREEGPLDNMTQRLTRLFANK